VEWFLSSVVLFLLNVAVHEMGHASTALLLAHRVNAICIGPCTFSKGSDGYSVHFQPKKLLSFGGYIGSVPIHCNRLRLRQIAIVAAGPIASLVAAACFIAARFSVLATEKGYTLFFSWGAVLALFCFLVSIIPVGYSDGNMLLHLILKTSPGELLLNHLRIAQLEASSTLGEPKFGEASAGTQGG